jgi:hypothetical protein
VLLNTIRIVGPIIVGILIYVSVEVTAIKKKLIKSSSAHKKLNNTKLNNYFL